MRIDLPRCNFKNCKYCFDGNCTSKKQYERCDYLYARDEAITEFAERLKSKCDAPHWCVWLSEIEDLENEMKGETDEL